MQANVPLQYLIHLSDVDQEISLTFIDTDEYRCASRIDVRGGFRVRRLGSSFFQEGRRSNLPWQWR